MDVSSPNVIGRQRERDQLYAFLDDMLAGRGSLVLIGGEAGIGKTTLVDAVVTHAIDARVRVAAGHCYDTVTTPPYGPWIEMMEGFPTGNMLPFEPPAAEARFGRRPIDDRATLYRYASDQIISLAAQQPLLLIIDDLHWADEASIDFLRHVSRHALTHPLLVVTTYRADELTSQHPLSQILPRLIHESRAHRIDLQRLGQAEIRALVRSRFALESADEARLTDVLQRTTEGNPFFIVELLNMLVNERRITRESDAWVLESLEDIAVPPLVRHVIGSRLARLGERTNVMLETLAVIGQASEIDLLQRVFSFSDEILDAALMDALDHQVISEQRRNSFVRFSHPLLQQAVYERLAPLRRRELHRLIGTELAAAPSPDIDLVADHFQRAGDDHAIDLLIQAGVRAQRLYAPQVAIQRFTRAITLAEELCSTVPSDAFRLRGAAFEAIGEFKKARHDLEMALRLARLANDPHHEWQVLIDLGLLWSSRDYEATGARYQQALTLARQLDDPALVAHSLNRLGNWHLNNDRPLQAMRDHHQALTMFENLGDARGSAVTLDLLGMSAIINGDLAASRGYYERAIALFRLLGDRQDLISPLASLGTCSGDNAVVIVATEPEKQEQLIAGLREALEIARETGSRSGEAYCLTTMTGVFGSRGAYRRAIEAGTLALSIAEEIEHHQWLIRALVRNGNVFLDLLDPERAKPILERAREMADSVHSLIWIRFSTALLARTEVALGLLYQAEAHLDGLEDAESMYETFDTRVWTFARAELALAAGSAERALAIVDRLIATDPGERGKTIPILSTTRGMALLSLGRIEEAEDALHSARLGAVSLGYRPMLWRIDTALSMLHARQGHAAQARQAARRARLTIADLAEEVPDTVLRQHFMSNANALVDAVALSSQEPSIDTLTMREMDVLRLVVEGLTDPLIAERLGVSVRTVHAHLRSIYNKLDVPTRAAATRVAIEHHLLTHR